MREGNNFLIEGTDDNERTGLLQIMVPPIEAIQTVDVVTSNFDPELGRATGAVTNVILKSGGNTLHGAAYEFLQNSDLDARSFFNPSVPHIAYNYVGGNIGGAIKKNKLFFFGDWPFGPWSLYRGEYSSWATHTCTYLWRTGDSRGERAAPYLRSGSPVNLFGRRAADPIPGFTNQTSRPAASIRSRRSILGPASGLRSAGGRLPVPVNNYFGMAAIMHQDAPDSLDAKLDYNLSDKDRLSGRFSFSCPVVFQAPLFGLAGGEWPRRRVHGHRLPENI